MAKTESTAVNALIELVQTSTPLKPNPADDLMFAAPPSAPDRSKRPTAPRVTATVPPTHAAGEVAPLPRHQSARGTMSQPNSPAQVRVSAAPVRTMTIPPLQTPTATRTTRPSMPPPPRSQGTPAPELFSRSPRAAAPPPSMPIAAPFELPAPAAPRVAAMPPPPKPAPTQAADMTSQQPWFDAHQTADHELDDLESVSTIDGTQPVGKQATNKLVGKIVLLSLGFVVAGALVGGFIAFNGEGGAKPVASKPVASKPVAVAAVAPVALDPNPSPSPSAAPAPAPAAPAVVADPAPNTAAVAFVDVRIDSTPSGATVMLVDKGKTTFLGTTPISTSLDPSHGYDVVFAYESQPTEIEHLEPSVTTHLSIALGKHAAAPAPAPLAAPKAVAAIAPTPAPIPAPAPKLAAVAPAPKAIAPTPAPAPAPKKAETMEAAAPVAAAAGGDGTLMIASKPPCEIYVDGKATGLTTPQRAIPLSAGAHKITLVGASDKSVKKTIAVKITANQPTKVIQDLMAK